MRWLDSRKYSTFFLVEDNDVRPYSGMRRLDSRRVRRDGRRELRDEINNILFPSYHMSIMNFFSTIIQNAKFQVRNVGLETYFIDHA